MQKHRFSTAGIIPKEENQASLFLEKHPEYNGKGILVGVLDTGVDLGLEGLRICPDGKPKIIDIVDATGAGDVLCSKLVKPLSSSEVTLLSGRKVNSSIWKGAENGLLVGIKRAYELYPHDLIKRLKVDRKKDFSKRNNEFISKLNAQGSLVPFLSAIEDQFDDPGDVFDVICFKSPSESESVDGGLSEWNCVVLGLDQQPEEVKPLRDYKIKQEWSTFSEETCLNYAVKIYEDGKRVNIFVPSGAHGSHVAGIIGAYYPNQPELCGLAPGCQIINIKIGDNRLQTMETGVGIIRGLNMAKRLGCHICNFSYGEMSSLPNIGRFVKYVSQLVWDYNCIFVRKIRSIFMYFFEISNFFLCDRFRVLVIMDLAFPLWDHQEEPLLQLLVLVPWQQRRLWNPPIPYWNLWKNSLLLGQVVGLPLMVILELTSSVQALPIRPSPIIF